MDMARGRPINWTPEMNATLERMLAEGHTTGEIARALNLDATHSAPQKQACRLGWAYVKMDGESLWRWHKINDAAPQSLPIQQQALPTTPAPDERELTDLERKYEEALNLAADLLERAENQIATLKASKPDTDMLVEELAKLQSAYQSLERELAEWRDAAANYSAHIVDLQNDVTALRPDAEKWREQQAAMERQQQNQRTEQSYGRASSMIQRMKAILDT